MKFRKLRIAWSVGWGVACLLLVALWVRSYWWSDELTIPISGTHYGHLTSRGGEISAYKDQNIPPWFPGNWSRRADAIKKVGEWPFQRIQDSELYRGTFGFGVIYTPTSFVLGAPHCFFAVLFGVLATVPWMRLKFSLRTLLIAMTVAAIGLGGIVYALRK